MLAQSSRRCCQPSAGVPTLTVFAISYLSPRFCPRSTSNRPWGTPEGSRRHFRPRTLSRTPSCFQSADPRLPTVRAGRTWRIPLRPRPRRRRRHPRSSRSRALSPFVSPVRCSANSISASSRTSSTTVEKPGIREDRDRQPSTNPGSDPHFCAESLSRNTVTPSRNSTALPRIPLYSPLILRFRRKLGQDTFCASSINFRREIRALHANNILLIRKYRCIS